MQIGTHTYIKLCTKIKHYILCKNLNLMIYADLSWKYLQENICYKLSEVGNSQFPLWFNQCIYKQWEKNWKVPNNWCMRKYRKVKIHSRNKACCFHHWMVHACAKRRKELTFVCSVLKKTLPYLLHFLLHLHIKDECSSKFYIVPAAHKH